jgi:hypothetical protein
METISEQLVPSFGAFINEKKENEILASYTELNEENEEDQELMNEAKYKKGDSLVTKKDVTMPVYDMLRKEKVGAKGQGSKSIKKGQRIEIQAVLKSKEGDVIYKTNFDSFDAVEIDKL